VKIHDLIAENDKVAQSLDRDRGGDWKECEFSGIVIWRIAKRQLVERWA
jgi:hypothetical protein